jgi:hypothetical protein
MNTNKEKRYKRRMKQELVVGVRTKMGLVHAAYTIDLSRSGVKIGSPLLMLSPGDRVELIIDTQGRKYPFSGQVERTDGHYYINRIHRSVNAFFIKIDDERFSTFAIDHYYV